MVRVDTPSDRCHVNNDKILIHRTHSSRTNNDRVNTVGTCGRALPKTLIFWMQGKMTVKPIFLFTALSAGFGFHVAAFISSAKIPKAPESLVLLRVASLHDMPVDTKTTQDNYETLLQTVTTRKVPPDTVFASMRSLEMQSYHDVRDQSPATAERMESDLVGDWSPIFSSGTTTTQERLGGRRVNYFPIKAVISFRPQVNGVGLLQNGLYYGSYHWVRLTGTYQYKPDQRRLHFGYHHMSLFNGAIQADFKEGQDIQFALATGLGGKIGLWNILLADQAMMMARGAGRGLTLWKRIQGHKAVLPPDVAIAGNE